MNQAIYRSVDQQRVGRILPDLIRARQLLGDLVSRELRARYRYATLGLLWTVLEPLALMGVLWFVFGSGHVFGARTEPIAGAGCVPLPYHVMLLCGLVFWQYLATALTAATQSLLVNQNLVTKVYFTREVIPIASMVYPLVNLGIGCVLLLAVHGLSGGTFGVGLLWLPAVFLIQFVMVLGLGLLLACGQVLYRDVGHLVAVALTFGFYATPVFYDLCFVTEGDSFPGWAKTLYLANPMAEMNTVYRQILSGAGIPDPSLLAWPTCIALLALMGGVVVFRRSAPTLSDHL